MIKRVADSEQSSGCSAKGCFAIQYVLCLHAALSAAESESHIHFVVIVSEQLSLLLCFHCPLGVSRCVCVRTVLLPSARVFFSMVLHNVIGMIDSSQRRLRSRVIVRESRLVRCTAYETCSPNVIGIALWFGLLRNYENIF